jgi:hypothetical protein
MSKKVNMGNSLSAGKILELKAALQDAYNQELPQEYVSALEFVRQNMNEIAMLLKKRRKFSDITDILNAKGLQISASTLRNYYYTYRTPAMVRHYDKKQMDKPQIMKLEKTIEGRNPPVAYNQYNEE